MGAIFVLIIDKISFFVGDFSDLAKFLNKFFNSGHLDNDFFFIVVSEFYIIVRGDTESLPEPAIFPAAAMFPDLDLDAVVTICQNLFRYVNRDDMLAFEAFARNMLLLS